MNRIIVGVLAAAACVANASRASAQAEIRPLTGIIEGHEVGGVSVDMTGIVYAADFGDIVWRITPEGARSVFARGLYGAAGNAVDGKGALLQASFYADEVVRIDRTGKVTPFVVRGLNRPAGITVDRRSGVTFVTNCGDNTVARVTPGGEAETYARSDLFNCPYGVTLDRSGNLYVASYNDNRVVKVGPDGAVRPFATVSDKGLSHLCFKGDRLYVAAFRSHAIYAVSMTGEAERILGDGVRGAADGARAGARLSFPFGIGCHPWAPRLYVNEEPDGENAEPRRSTVRVIRLSP